MKKPALFPWVIFASAALLLGVIILAWRMFLPPKPVMESGLSPTTPLPEIILSKDEHAHETLPAISPEMAVAIRQLSNHSTDGLQETVNPDGSITLDHKDRLQSVMVGVVGPDGKIIIRHGEDFLQNVKPE
jgi:hypothetical protein